MPDRELLIADKDFRRLDQCLAALSELSRSRVQGLIEEGLVKKNGKDCKGSDRVKTGDAITYSIPEAREIALKPENIPIEIVYEDEDICVVNKPRGMVVHPAPGNEEGTLVNALLYHFGSLSTIGGENRPGVVHRIDKMTSGLLVIAKNDRAHENLSRQFALHTAHRSYLALAAGNFKEDGGTVDAPIGRHPVDRKRMAVTPKGKNAVTHWQVLQRFSVCTLLKLELETGRTHQIRVHMAYINHPIVGDRVYSSSNSTLGMEGQALHGFRLRLAHPVTNETLTFYAPLPEDMKGALKKLSFNADTLSLAEL